MLCSSVCIKQNPPSNHKLSIGSLRLGTPGGTEENSRKRPKGGSRDLHSFPSKQRHAAAVADIVKISPDGTATPIKSTLCSPKVSSSFSHRVTHKEAKQSCDVLTP
ncbi:hypothetical protein DQ04_20861000 [Trypanosoma grayi]|uniref:hypothetical protein n=1 Tax=Trypanosoma grayi TaxID=71804 RepID=UPI0004F434CF|nr:hypothetical protein DQ04_20861000 [Trypanosoma grayi]KEG05527.1 hypothetical protein DQ04_20861000 [Trypanosoma grayi]